MGNKITAEKVITVLREHPGADQGLRARDLVEMITAERSSTALERELRQVVSELRNAGWPICAHPSNGYYWAKSIDELDEICAWLRKRALTSLQQVQKLKQLAYPVLQGQLSFPLPGMEPTIPNVEIKDYSQPVKVGLVIHVPEDLNDLVQEYLNESNWDRDELCTAALALFLMQRGKPGKVAQKHYLDIVLGDFTND